MALTDSFGRHVTYARISLTDRCNYRCVYCMPAQGDPFTPNPELLSDDEVVELAQVLGHLGVRKLRLTGGEPLVRRGVPALVHRIKGSTPIEHVALTTNAHLLTRRAGPLAEAGLDSINVSLDSLDAARFAELTRHGDLARVLAGIDAAIEAGIPSIKLNAVVIRGFNDDELTDLVEYAIGRGVIMRFIEFMPIGEQTIWGHSGSATCVPAKEIRAVLSSRWFMEAEPGRYGAGPARYWRLFGPGAPEQGHPMGIIAAVTECFCADCNRVRITSRGGLRACLADDHEVDLRDILRSGAPAHQRRAALTERVGLSLGLKKERHDFDLARPGVTMKAMNAIGG
ncbi:MAG: GTP 3',8-cyclase MoaA [Myxococcota bacterium]